MKHPRYSGDCILVAEVVSLNLIPILVKLSLLLTEIFFFFLVLRNCIAGSSIDPSPSTFPSFLLLEMTDCVEILVFLVQQFSSVKATVSIDPPDYVRVFRRDHRLSVACLAVGVHEN